MHVGRSGGWIAAAFVLGGAAGCWIGLLAALGRRKGRGPSVAPESSGRPLEAAAGGNTLRAWHRGGWSGPRPGARPHALM